MKKMKKIMLHSTLIASWKWLILSLILTTSAFAEPRIAWVIGNSHYSNRSWNSLPNAKNDAQDMAHLLRQYDFTVFHSENMTRQSMEEQLNKFIVSLKSDTVGLFYYAGHAIQVNGINYLVPVDANIRQASEVEKQSLSAQQVIAEMEKTNNRLSIIILDACRDNPFANQRSGTSHTGLAQMYAPSYIPSPQADSRGFNVLATLPQGSIIGFATAPDKTASENPRDQNGLYTKYLLQAMKNPDWALEKIFKEAATNVAYASNHQQIPWRNSSLLGPDFCFGTCQSATTTSTPPSFPSPPDNRVWSDERIFRDRLDDGSLGPEMVIIPAGSFKMGDLQNDGEEDEKPVHQVTLARFAIGRYEVKVSEFRQFVQATGYQTDAEKTRGCYKNSFNYSLIRGASWQNPSTYQDDNYPVVCISWHDAMAYVEWLQNTTGKPYMLPSEAQWEYMARSGTEMNYWWGNEMDERHANCWRKYQPGILPVGSVSPNSGGIYDTIGNVLEWVADPWHDNYISAPLNGEVWQQGGDQSRRVLRGGSWNSQPHLCRVSNRFKAYPDRSEINLGFRVACQLD
jgi:formylglycine-generating enzyme required for sulfatase activity